MDRRTQPLIEALCRIWESSQHISESFSVIFASFRDFQLERDVTDQPTDRASYRGAMAHLKKREK